MLEDIRRTVDSSGRKLFQTAAPPVKLWLLLDVMKRDPGDPIVEKTREECATYPPRVRLLNSLRDDGTWPIPRQRKLEEERGPGPPVGWTYITMLRNLHALGEFHAVGADERIELALDRLQSWQADDGHIPGPWGTTYPVPHYNGYALRDLLQFEREDDPRTQKLVDWLLKMQRHDGGWNIPYIQDVRYLPQYRGMSMNEFKRVVEAGETPAYDPGDYDDVPSCIWCTMMVVRGLSWSRDRMLFAEATRRGAEFFLNNFFKPNFHSSFLKSEKNWTTLKYPTYLGSGLCALDILTVMGYRRDDPRMEKPIRWLLRARSNDGFWYRSERPRPYEDQWITEIALSVLARYAEG